MVALMKKLCEICDKEFETDSKSDYIVIIVVENQQEVIIAQENIRKQF